MSEFSGFRTLRANFTGTPNQYFDSVVGHCEPCVERVVAILIRATLGWEDPDTGERRLEAELALADFLRPKLCESSARKGIAGAIQAGFIVETQPATNKQPARYALRWEDDAAQRQALERQRKAHGTDRRRGVDVMTPRWKRTGAARRGVDSTPLDLDSRGVEFRPLEFRPLESTPPLNKRNSSEKKKERESKKQKQTLNVGEGVNCVDFAEATPDAPGGTPSVPAVSAPSVPESAPATPSPAMPGAAPEALGGVFSAARDAEAAQIAAALQDAGSERRHRQLLEVCERHGLSDLPRRALQATRERAGRAAKGGGGAGAGVPPIERPGAYYQRVLLALLEDHQVFVPKAGEDDAAEVRRQAMASLGLEGLEGQGGRDVE